MRKISIFILCFFVIAFSPAISFSDTTSDINSLLERECINLKKEKLSNLILTGFSSDLQKGLDPDLLKIMEGVIKRTDFDGISEEKTFEIIKLVYGAYKKGASLEYLDLIFDVAYSKDISVEQLFAAANALKEFYNSDVPQDIYEEFVYHAIEEKWDPSVMPTLTRGLIYGVDRGLTAQKVALAIIIDVDQNGLKKKSADELVLDAIKFVRENEPEKWKPMKNVERELMMKLAKKRELEKLRQDAETKKNQKELERQSAEEDLKKKFEEDTIRLSEDEKKVAMDMADAEKRNYEEIMKYELEQEKMRKMEEEEKLKFEQERQRLIRLQQEAERKKLTEDALKYQREQEEIKEKTEEENRRLRAERDRIDKEVEATKRKNLEKVKKYQEEQENIKDKLEKEKMVFAKEKEKIAREIEKMVKAYQDEISKYQKEESEVDKVVKEQAKEMERDKERKNREREEKRRKELAAMEQKVSEYGKRGNLDMDKLFSTIDKHIGIPYQFGGDSENGIDCSAFTRRVYREQGIELPRTSQQQSMIGGGVGGNPLQPGDLVFFNTSIMGGISHVGVYMDNNTFAHASSSQGVTKSNLRERYFSKRYVRANRIMGE
ncbi:MAG: C40 family peptidase [Nitrospinae bacterium]|nr:C40 family peptidase [Nitrospinota bacterium]